MPRIMSSVVGEPRMESRSGALPIRAGARSRFAGKHVHFIGVGGCGMSGLASMLIDDGAIVTGSEPAPNRQTLDLTARGAKISRDQLGELLDRRTELVVRSAAVTDSNLEFRAASKLGIETIKYAQLLGQVMAERCGVAVAGTHGKSTTTAMIAFALSQCGADLSFVVGGTVPQLAHSGSRSGKSNLFVAEACEYDRSFHNLRPRVALITNIEEDHLDCYRNIYEIVESFRHFAAMVPSDGMLIVNGRDLNVANAVRDLPAHIETVSLSPGTTWSTMPTGLSAGCPTGAVCREGRPIATIELSIPGQHNLMNATMALAACVACGVSPVHAAEAIGLFTGVDRRMTVVGTFRGATVIDDYGHHPTEIRATLDALRQRYNPKRLLCVFQPHQHSRTRFLLEDFADSFAAADLVIVPDIYFVRDSESERQQINSADLVRRIVAFGHQAIHLPEFPRIIEHLRKVATEGDLIVTMGAGNVWEIGRELVS